MKTLRLLSGILWLLVGINAKAQVPPARQDAELRTHLNEADYGKFDGHGKLVFQELYQDDVPAEWHMTLAYYPYGSHQAVKMHRNVTAMNVFLAAEIRQPRTVRTFIKKHLWHFLASNLGDVPTLAITPTGSGENLDDYLLEADRRPAPAARRAQLKAKLQEYARLARPVMAGNGWTMDANVITANGAVEHWLIKGRVAPLQIDSFLCEPKEPEGTFKQPLIWLR